MAILTVVGALALAVFGKLLADEIKAWRPKICDVMIKCAASQLLPFQRERYIEQWRCDLEEIPGDLSKLYFAVDLIRGTWLARVSPDAKQVMLSAIENSEEVAVRWFVFLEVACWREKVRLIIEDRCCLDIACPTFVAYRKLYEQVLVSFAESGENLFNEQKKLSCGRLSDSIIAGRMLQRVIENNTRQQRLEHSAQAAAGRLLGLD
ncbi:MAG: hypothetical protein ABSG96_06665 [Terracidiphilus sp.]|jgi:hypothetical protein